MLPLQTTQSPQTHIAKRRILRCRYDGSTRGWHDSSSCPGCLRGTTRAINQSNLHLRGDITNARNGGDGSWKGLRAPSRLYDRWSEYLAGGCKSCQERSGPFEDILRLLEGEYKIMRDGLMWDIDPGMKWWHGELNKVIPYGVLALRFMTVLEKKIS